MQTSLRYIVHAGAPPHELHEVPDLLAGEGNEASSTEGPMGRPKRRAPRLAASYPRKRAIQACRTCRFRRTKCDNARPSCASCVRRGAECIYQPTDTSTFDAASLTILHRLDDLERLIQAKGPEPEPMPVSVPAALTTSVASTSPSGPRSVVFDPRMYGQRSFISVEAVLQWPIFDDQDFPTRLQPISLTDGDQELAALPALVDINLPGAESCLRNFFDHVHVFNPILEEHEVREYLKLVQFNGIGWDAKSCLLLLIYANGSIATPFMQHDLAGLSPGAFHQSPACRLAQTYFLAAQKRMGMLLCHSGVIEAQCFFLAGVYLMNTLRPVEAWKMFVQAMACCHGFGIHLETGTSDEWNPRQRIYWTCFKSELELRLELNLSHTNVADLKYPTFFPSPPEGLKTQDEAAWYFYLAEIALRRLENRVLSHLFRTEPISDAARQDAVLDFEDQIDGWLRSLPETLSLHVPGDALHEALRFILHGHLLDCQEIMYWQYVADAAHGRPSDEVFLRKALKVCVERIRQNSPGFYHRHHGTWLMVRSCTRSAFVLLAAVRQGDLAPFLPLGWEEAVLDVARMLRYWKDESSDVYEMLLRLEMLIDHGK